MRNILIFKFPYSSLFGGGEKHTIQLVEEMQKKGFNFYLVSSCRVLLREFQSRHWPAKKKWAGIEPVSKSGLLLWPVLSPIVFFSLFGTLLYYRLAKKVTLIYCLSLTEKLLATLPARMLGMKVVWMEHVTFERWLSQNPLRIFYRWWSRLATVVAVSRAVKKQLTEVLGVAESNVKVIYHGVDLHKFQMREYRWEQAARYNIGCIARLEKEKGIEFLIQAVHTIREFIPFARLIIVGNGPERKKLVWLAERIALQEGIQWVGYQREINKWYSYFDAFALPSVTRESFGITLVEAMASGVPVVASRLGGVPEIIIHRNNGLLAEPGNSRDLADQLLYIFNNRGKIKEMVNSARRTVEEKFNNERMARDYYLLFRN